MTRIDMVTREDGKVVCGYNAAWATDEELEEGHSYNGYTLNVFDSETEAREYYQEYFPDCSLV